MPAPKAPADEFVRPAGVGVAVAFTLQGFIVDSAALNGEVATTNAIVVVSQ